VSEALYFLESDNKLYLRAQGHITAALCADLRQLVFSRFEAAPDIEEMWIDLSACEYMDSTFMGLLVAFNKRLAKIQGHRLALVQPTALARELLEGLGISALVDLVDAPVAFPQGMKNIVKSTNSDAELLLSTHENLMELSEANRKKFSGLQSVLKKQLNT